MAIWLSDLFNRAVALAHALHATISTSSAAIGSAFLALLTAYFLGAFVFPVGSQSAAQTRCWRCISMRDVLVQWVAAYCCLGNLREWITPTAAAVLYLLIRDGAKCIGRCWIEQKTDDWTKMRRQLLWFIFSQFLHLACLLLLLVLLQHFFHAPKASQWVERWGTLWLQLLTLLRATLATYVGGEFIGIFVKPLVTELEDHRRKVNANDAQRGFANGGRVIGQLERALIFVLVLIGQPAGVGFLVAAKSIFRFGDLTNHGERMEAEYITIGTMASFAWGLTIAWLTQYSLQNL